MARAEGAQANNKRAARQCEKRRWFAPRKVSVFFVDYGPKGAGGQAKSHLAFLPEYLYPVGFFANYGPKGTGGERKAPSAPVGANPRPTVGHDAPTPARKQGLQPYGVLTLFFRWRKKSVQKQASGTATPGKSPLLPILAAGLAMSRAA